MDKERFRQLTKHLLRWSAKLERDVLIASTTPKPCDHCPKLVVNQRISCEPHKLGHRDQHFKHKCHECRHTVYDGSYVKEPRQLRAFNNYTPTTKLLTGTPPGPRLTKNGKLTGRPPKPKVEQPKKPMGRPRKIKPIEPKRAVGRPRKKPL